VVDVAKRVSKAHHPFLLDARIAFILRSETPRSGGRYTLGKANRVSTDLGVHIDYERSHCAWDGETASSKGHDVEEFTHMIARDGFWWPSSDALAMALPVALPLSQESKEPSEGTVGTIDSAKVAKEVESAMRAERLCVEETHHSATSRERARWHAGA
jgi:hypothetical protein